MLLITRCNLPQINPGKATNHYRIVGHSDQVLDSQLEELGSNIDAKLPTGQNLSISFGN